MLQSLYKKILAHRRYVVTFLILLQIALIVFLTMTFSGSFRIIYFGLEALGLVEVLYLSMQQNTNPRFILSWTLIILGIPLIGPVLYLLLGNRKIPREMREREPFTHLVTDALMNDHEYVIERIATDHPNLIKNVNYIDNIAHYPVYSSTETKFMKSGEMKFKHFMKDLNSAQKYIFLEYFIVKKGYFWQSVYDVLVEKANQGVIIKLLLDDFGCPEFDNDYLEEIRSHGIEIELFNPLTARFTVFMNNRNHRKIAVIDGKVGYIGGINIADEYINRIERFGHWKDVAVRIRGEAVFSLTEMFLQLFNYYTDTPSAIEDYVNDIIYCEPDGYVQPFSDSPTDNFFVSETLHINLITQANKSVHICTPYLVVGYEMLRAITAAAQSGVDVRIVLPAIPDKKLVNMITKSYYDKLIQAGVRVYEYTPGFIHSKSIVIDGKEAIIGTANLDFRSYYLNFECGIYFIESQVIYECEQDFFETLLACDEITKDNLAQLPFYQRIFRAFVSLFSGLM